MRTVALSEIFPGHVSGYWGKDPGDLEEDVRVVRNGDVLASGTIRWDQAPIRSLKASEAAKSELVAGDLLLTTSGDCARVAYVDHAERRSCASNFVRRLRADPATAFSRYLFHLMNSERFRSQCSPYIRGTTLQNLSVGPAFDAVEIPLPSIEEQRRIAAVLDAADAVRAKRRQALAKLDTLTQAIFIDMFGDPVANDRGWPFARLEDLCTKIQIGPFGSLLHQADYIAGGVPLVNPMHIVNGEIVPHPEQTVSPEKHEKLRTYWLEQGDVVMGRRGEMGRVAIVDERTAGYMCGSGSLFFRPDTSRVIPYFVAAVLASDSGRRRLEQSAQGVTMPNLNGDIVAKFALGVPPVDLQDQFTEAVAERDRIGVSQNAHLAALECCFASLQQRAFRGEL